ncbi:amidohydrolase family protein [Elongatibacter sediminis]|uniref:Amidohydrolase family protein n=1 Tax=Elongatibacter sediminis TaxID=3119006 RepID=A0AAW9RDG2_9GAMM
MSGLARLLASVLLLLPWTVQGSDDAVLIQIGWLLSDPARPPLENIILVVRDGRITDLRDGTDRRDADAGMRQVDLKDKYVVPGFIDLHVHLTTPASPGGELRTVSQSGADLALVALELGQRNLAAGFTTVVDLGTGRRAHDEAIYALRKAIAEGRVTGPRIVVAGSPLSPTGASRTGRYRPAVDAAISPPGVCDGADDCRRVVREQIAAGADIINVYNSGSLNDPHMVQQTFTDEEFAVIIETAHALGRRVIADGHTAAGINAALRAGADIVDTAPWPDDESWRLMRANNTVFVPHLYAFEQVVGDAPESLADGTMHWIPSPIMKRLYDIKNQPYSAERAYREGVALAFGSDTGVIPHGANGGEFAELVRIGLTPAEAIGTATSVAAGALGLERELGTLEVGKVADLVAVNANPLENIRVLEHVRFVMKGGRVVRDER